jgi:hypothetical protein
MREMFLGGASKSAAAVVGVSTKPWLTTIGSTPRLAIIAGVLGLLSGCIGESFVAQNLRDPKTGKAVGCVGHVGPGSPSQAELDTMSACVSWYLSRG